MRRSQKLAATALAGTLLATALGAAGAAASDSTTVQLTVDGGDLTLDIAGEPTAVSELTSGTSLLSFTDDMAFSGALPATTVTDERGEPAATWTVQVSAGGADFERVLDSTGEAVEAGDANEIPAANGRVYLGGAGDALTDVQSALSSTINGMSITGAELQVGTNNLSNPYTLVEGATADLTGLLGLTDSPELVFTPNMEVSVPAGTAAGTYEITVTETVS